MGTGLQRIWWARAAVAATATLAMAMAPTASAQSGEPVGPWDGSNPFNCVNQDVGTGTAFPDPDADPFCVEFDKTNQNVTDFGIVDFLSQEPTRVAVAGDKCFYFQHDHWTGSIVQGAQPEVWHWDGSYYFDRAKGVGGAYLTNFRIGGQPADATPYVPAPYRPYFSATGGGGAKVLLESDPDPICGAKVDTAAERDQVYAGRPHETRCIEPGGRIGGRRIGGARLGMPPKRLEQKLGPPGKRKHGTWRWCVVGGSTLRVAFAGKGAHRGAAVIRTTAFGQHLHGVGAGSKSAKAVKRLHLHQIARRVHGRQIWARAPRGGSRLLVGIRAGRVSWLGLADPHRIKGRSALVRALRRLG